MTRWNGISGPKSRAWVEVDLAAVVDNARTVARCAGTRLLPMVKANGYGVGAAAVCKALEAVDPWGYGVATVDEGADLRAAGITRPVVVFMPIGPALFEEFERFRLTPVLGDAGAIAGWTAREGGARPFHLESGTGMGRSGERACPRGERAPRARGGERELRRAVDRPAADDRGDARHRLRGWAAALARVVGARCGAAPGTALSHHRRRDDGPVHGRGGGVTRSGGRRRDADRGGRGWRKR